MGRLFLRKKFSDYLGEQRAIDDIYIQYVADGPAPSPSPTPSVTPTPTITPTSTITPTITPTSTITPTPSETPSVTPTPTTTTTPTVTPSITPTITPTNTSSPTPTPTLTPTPSPVVEYHLQAENTDNILAENGDFIDIETPTTTYTVTASGSIAYLINGSPNPTLTLMRGQTYTFNINAVGHPFWIKTAPGTGTGNQYNTGVTNNGTANGTITWTVDAGAPSTLYYNCQIHSLMAGVFNIV